MDFLGILSETFARSGFANLSWQQGVMLLISFVLLLLINKLQAWSWARIGGSRI